MNPASALAATTAGEPKYTCESRIAHASFEIPIRRTDCDFAFAVPVHDRDRCTFRNRAAAESRRRPPKFASRLWIQTSPAFPRSPPPDRIQRRPRRVRRECARLRPRRANLRSAHSHMKADTLSESAHAFAASPATTPLSSLR